MAANPDDEVVYKGQMGGGPDEVIRVTVGYRQNWMTARTIDIMVPGDIAADLRYLTAEEDEDSVNWEEVKQILLAVPGLSVDDALKLRRRDVLGINFDG